MIIRTMWLRDGTVLLNYWLVTHNMVHQLTCGLLDAYLPSYLVVKRCGQAAQMLTNFI